MFLLGERRGLSIELIVIKYRVDRVNLVTLYRIKIMDIAMYYDWI